MTKRILAAFLAVMMVVGLLPTSVFAAPNAECKVAETFDDHSKLHCELVGVEYTMVPNSTVAPECGQDGYTLYQCACGAYFADDIVDTEPHIPTTTEPKVARVEPTCAAAGKAAIFECATCGKDYFDPNDADADANGVIKATGKHTWETDYSGNDCTATEQFCEVCGAKNDKHVPQAEHVWNYNDPNAIVLAPTAHDAGKAVFYCSNANCNQPHEVTVAPLNHEAFLKHVPATVPNCTTKGNVEHWVCETCNKYYIEEAGLKVEVEAEDVVLAEKHEWLPNAIKTEPTCTTYGFIYYLCDACGETRGEDGSTEITVLPKLGHTAYPCQEHINETVAACADCRAAAGTYGAAYVEPNCTVAGEKSWYCGRCNELRTEPVKATGHAVKSVTVPATHKYKYSYIIDYCTNENCTAAPAEVYYSATAKQNLDVTVEIRNGKVYDMPAGSTIALLNVRTVKAATPAKDAHFYVEDAAVQPATCTEPGKAFWYCDGTATGCNEHADEVLPALGHIFEDETNDIEATCDANAFKVCDRNCGEEDWMVEQKDTKGHVLGDFVMTTLPTCTGDKGYDWHVCERCAVVVENPASETKFVANKTYRGTETLTAKEEFEAEHPGFNPANYIPYRDGDCINEGYWKAPCGDCGKTYLVLVDNTGKGHIAPAGTTYHEEATCTVAKGYVQYVCVFCGETVKNTNKPLGHKMTETKKLAPTCTEDGHEAYWTCSNEWCQVPVILNGIPTGKTTPILYKDKNGAAAYAAGEEVIPALNHAKSVVATVRVTCTTPGFEVELCGNGCGYEMVINYVEPIGHEKDQKVTVAPDCETAGEEYYICANGCNEKLEYKELPALGHMNAAEKVFYDICTDTTKDRVCVRANCNKVELDAKGNRKPIAQSHTEVTVTVDACCEHYGYTMKTCANECETYVDVVENILAPLGHTAPWGYVSNDATIAIPADVVAPYAQNVKAYTPATYDAKGSVTFICEAAECCQDGGAEVTRDVVVTGVDFTFEIDNASVAGADKFVDSNVIAVDVFMNAFEAKVWGFDVDVAYNADSMNYLGHVFHAGDIFGKQMVNDNTAKGYVSMAAYTEAEIGGVIADADIAGTVKVATLYFQLETYVALDTQVAPNYRFETVGKIDITDANISYAEGEEKCGTAAENFDITLMLDSNANETITIKDLQICYEILKGQAVDADGKAVDYLAAADANKDGEIDLLDLDLMNQYLVGKATEQDVYAANKWAAPEGFVAG